MRGPKTHHVLLPRLKHETKAIAEEGIHYVRYVKILEVNLVLIFKFCQTQFHSGQTRRHFLEWRRCNCFIT